MEALLPTKSLFLIANACPEIISIPNSIGREQVLPTATQVERIHDPDDCNSEDDDPILSKDDTISDASNPDEPSFDSCIIYFYKKATTDQHEQNDQRSAFGWNFIRLKGQLFINSVRGCYCFETDQVGDDIELGRNTDEKAILPLHQQMPSQNFSWVLEQRDLVQCINTVRTETQDDAIDLATAFLLFESAKYQVSILVKKQDCVDVTIRPFESMGSTEYSLLHFGSNSNRYPSQLTLEQSPHLPLIQPTMLPW